MRGKIIKPRSLLLDANIIIEAYKLNVWENLLERVSIAVPSIIAQDEVLFYSRRNQRIPSPIDLRALYRSQKISILEATSTEMIKVHSIFDRNFISQLHPGETEALALLYCRENSNYHFCSADAMAIKALAMLDLSHLAISFEKCLASHGLKKALDEQFKDGFLKKLLKIGQAMKITGEGLAKKS